MNRSKIAIITPVYNEVENISILYRNIEQVMQGQRDVDWEFILVDDHSTDGSDVKLRKLTKINNRVRYLRFTKNEGSHIAIFAGLAF